MSSPTKTWTVVCFIADETVEAVPTRWINGDDCLWPVVTREKLNALIKKCEFNTCWPTHKVKTFRNATYDSYGVARSKALKAEYTSDLNTDEGEMFGSSGKRVRKKKVQSSSESENDEPLKLNKKAKKNMNLPPPPAWQNKVDDIFDYEEKNNNYEDSQPSTSFTREDVTDSQLLRTTFTRTDFTEPQSITVTRTPLLETQPKSPVQAIKESMSKTQTNCCCPKLLYNIQSLLIEINLKVGKNNIEVEPNQSILEKSQMDFPLSQIENLKEFENFLSVSENYAALVRLFASLGGNNTYELIRRCLAPIMEDTLAEKFSFFGKKGKQIFGTTRLAKAIIEAAQKSGHASNNKETEQKIGDWLRRAKERNTRALIKKNGNDNT